jgi:hypothetical protein
MTNTEQFLAEADDEIKMLKNKISKSKQKPLIALIVGLCTELLKYQTGDEAKATELTKVFFEAIK